MKCGRKRPTVTFPKFVINELTTCANPNAPSMNKTFIFYSWPIWIHMSIEPYWKKYRDFRVFEGFWPVVYWVSIGRSFLFLFYGINIANKWFLIESSVSQWINDWSNMIMRWILLSQLTKSNGAATAHMNSNQTGKTVCLGRGW